MLVVRRLISGILVGGLLLSVPAHAAESSISDRLWVRDLQRSEEFLAAAIATSDAEEIRTQSFALSKILGRTQTLSENARIDCTLAGQALFNIAGGLLRLPPARALVAYRSDLALYDEHMPACERSVGVKGKRLLR